MVTLCKVRQEPKAKASTSGFHNENDKRTSAFEELATSR
jgi:hypothetical protein